MCVFFPSILDIKFVGRTSRGHTGGRSHRIFNPPSFCGACLDFCREKDSAIPFPRRPWSRILCTNELIVLHPLGIFILFFLVFSEKNPVCRDRTHVPTCQKVTRCLLSYRGRPASRVFYEKKQTNEPRPSEHPPVVVGKTNTEYTGSLGHNSVFRVSYITSVDRWCRRDPGYVQYHRNNYMLS